MKKHCLYGERGFALFGAILLIPLVLAASLLVYDISSWNSLRTSLQLAADEIAFETASALPDHELAIRAAAASARRSGVTGLRVALVFSSDRDLEVGVKLRTSFSSVAARFVGGLGRVLSVEREGRAAILPRDLVLVLGLGSTLRPVADAVAPDQLSAWGDASDWPQSEYYHCATAPKVADLAIWPEWANWNSVIFDRWITQSCFNPALSSLKLTAIELVDSTVGVRENRVGAIVSPGRFENEPFQLLRSLHPNQTVPGGFGGSEQTSTIAYAVWQPYRDSRFFLGDESCLLLSSQQAFGTRYVLPPRSIGIGSNKAEVSSCGNTLTESVCGREHFPFGVLGDCSSQNEISLRESIYWRAARSGEEGSPLNPRIGQSVAAGLKELLSPSLEQAELRRLRGNLSAHSLKQLIVLTDYLDQLNDSFEETLRAGIRGGVSMVFVVMRHPGLTSAQQELLTARIANLRSFSNSDHLGAGAIEILEASSPEDLHQRFSPYLQNFGREIILRR